MKDPDTKEIGGLVRKRGGLERQAPGTKALDSAKSEEMSTPASGTKGICDPPLVIDGNGGVAGVTKSTQFPL